MSAPTATQWEQIGDLRGPKGDKGDPGTPGADGGTTPHAARHATGGTDPLTPNAIGAQPASTPLSQIAGLTSLSDGQLLRRVAGAWAAATLTKSDVGLGNVDNTADSAKPVSTAQQTALDAKVNTAAANTANGWARLDSAGLLPPDRLPAIAVIDWLGSVGSQAAMLALTGQRGDWCTRTDLGTDWFLIADTPSQLSSWRERTTPTSPVSSVNGRTGAVTGLAEASDLAGYTPTSRTVTAGTGLTGGGSLAQNRTLAVNFGTGSGTAAQGNDSRIVGAEQTANRDQPNGYPSLDSNGDISVDELPSVLTRVRNGGNVSGSVTWSAANGNLINFTATGDCTFAGATGGVDGQELRMFVLASSAARTVTFSSGSAVPIFPVGHLPSSYYVPVGMVLVADLVYSTLAGCWLLVSADVEGGADGGTCLAANSAAQAVASNTAAIAAFGSLLQSTGLVTRSTDGVGHRFTLNRTGLWALSFMLQYQNTSTGHKRGHIVQTGTPAAQAPSILCGGSGHSPGTSGQGAILVGGAIPAVRLVAGTYLNVMAYCGTGSGDTLLANGSNFSATYLGP